MTINVNIGEAKTRFSELVAAAVRGEHVVISRAGQPQIRFVAIDDATVAERARVAEMRKSAIGMYAREFDGHEIDIGPSMSDEEFEERFRRKFGPAL